MRNIQEWRDIQGGEIYRVVKNLQGFRDLHKKKFTGGRKTYKGLRD